MGHVVGMSQTADHEDAHKPDDGRASDHAGRNFMIVHGQIDARRQSQESNAESENLPRAPLHVEGRHSHFFESL